MRIRYRHGPATAVYFSVYGYHFVLTASHVAKDMQKGDKFEVRFKRDWVSVGVRDVEHDDEQFDICAILPETQWGQGLDEQASTDFVYVGEEVAFIGFPLNLEVYLTTGDLGWPMGLVKSGIFSGSVPRPSDGKLRYFFDAHNNVGFSGGPIVAQRHGILKVAALVSEYWYDRPLPLMKKDSAGVETETDYFVAPNSGFMIGVPIEMGLKAAQRIASRLL